ncbi:MAG: MarR family winged helix-turn-helix transcriptional regulator [Thermomicrobiales bacterium]
MEVRDQRVNLAYELVITLPSFGRWVSSIWNSETPFGHVSHRQVTILWILRKREFMLGLTATASNFADLLSVRKSVITRVLASLESGGFVTRVSVPDDGRSQLIELTERGHALSVYIEEIFLQEMMGSIDFVSDAEIEQLFHVIPLLKRISINLEAARKQRVALKGENPYEEVGL